MSGRQTRPYLLVSRPAIHPRRSWLIFLVSPSMTSEPQLHSRLPRLKKIYPNQPFLAFDESEAGRESSSAWVGCLVLVTARKSEYVDRVRAATERMARCINAKHHDVVAYLSSCDDPKTGVGPKLQVRESPLESNPPLGRTIRNAESNGCKWI